MKTLRLAQTLAWPMNSERVCGLREVSAWSSSRLTAASILSAMRQLLEAKADQLLGAGFAPCLADGRGDGRRGLPMGIAEIGQRRNRVARGKSLRKGRNGGKPAQSDGGR